MNLYLLGFLLCHMPCDPGQPKRSSLSTDEARPPTPCPNRKPPASSGRLCRQDPGAAEPRHCQASSLSASWGTGSFSGRLRLFIQALPPRALPRPPVLVTPGNLDAPPKFLRTQHGVTSRKDSKQL